MTIVMISANGTARRGSRASPAGTGIDLVAAERKDQQQAGRREIRERRRRSPARARAGSTKNSPTAMNMTSGSSLPIVSTLRTRLLCRMPRMLIAAIATMTSVMKVARGRAGRERRPVEARATRREHVDDRRPAGGAREPQHPADLERREPAERRARVEVRAAGAVEAARHFGEATARSAATPRRRPRPSTGSRRRRWRHSSDGSANTAPPITWLTPMAVRSQRPSSRRSAGPGADHRRAAHRGRLYHDISWSPGDSRRRHRESSSSRATSCPKARARCRRRTTPTRRTSTANSMRCFGTMWICAGRLRAGRAARSVRRPRDRRREHHHHARRATGACTRSTTSAAIAARACARRRQGQFAGSIQCPYHAWTYGLDGRLVGAPHMDEVPHFRKEDYPLHGVQRRRLGRPHLHLNLSRRTPAAAVEQLADLPAQVPRRGACRICGSATGSSTTSGPTGS